MNRQKLLFLTIIILATVLRFISLERIPNGFIPEEVSTGWNAYSILKTGRDEWGTFLPLIFRETGGFKLALNSYLIVPVMAIFGPNEWSVRSTTAFAGVVAVILTYFLVKKLFGKESYALTAALFLAISPWHIAMGRYGVDVNWGVPLFLAGLLVFLKGRKQPAFYPVSAFLFGMTFYTYFNYVVFTWLFLVAWIWWERKEVWVSSRRRYLVIFFTVLFIMMLPYLVRANLTIRYSQATSVSRIGTLNQIHEHREACVSTFPDLICRALYNRPLVFGMIILRNYVAHFSTSTLFLHGAKLGLSGMPDGWGLLYLFEYPLIVWGIVVMIRKRQFTPLTILWLFFYGVPSSLAAEGHVWRMLTFLPLPQVISAIGFIEILRRFHQSWIRLGSIGISGFFVIYFLTDYFGYFPYWQASHAYYGFRDAYRYASQIEKNYPEIVVAPSGLGFDQLYIYYLFYLRPDPRAYQLEKDVVRTVGNEGWVQVSRIGKWRFVSDIKNIIFDLPDHTLYITDGTFKETEGFPLKVMLPELLYTVYYPNGDPAFKIISLRKNLDYNPEASLSATLK